MNRYIIFAIAGGRFLLAALYLANKKGLADFLDSQRTARLIRLLCCQAEQLILGSGKGAERLLYVCSRLYDVMPHRLQQLVTPGQLAETVDYIFKEFAVMSQGHRVALPQEVV